MTHMLARFLSRLRAPFAYSGAGPSGHYGMPYAGKYEPGGPGITGRVHTEAMERRFPPSSVIVLRDGQLAGSTTDLVQFGPGWTFKLALPSPVAADEVIKERLKVYAVDRVGARYELSIDGAIQLGYVREALSPPSETELVIEFSQGGNSIDFVRTGWSRPEQQHTWTEGKESTIAIQFAQPGARYRIEILAWPYAVQNVTTGQRMLVWIGDTFICSLYAVPGQNLLEFDMPGELIRAHDHVLRLELPDAVRPHEVTGDPDRRVLALAFRRLKVKRWLAEPPQGDAETKSSDISG